MSNLSRLRDAVVGRGRAVEVVPMALLASESTLGHRANLRGLPPQTREEDTMIAANTKPSTDGKDLIPPGTFHNC